MNPNQKTILPPLKGSTTTCFQCYNNLSPPPQFRMGTRLHTRANSPISPHKQKRNENLTPLHTPLHLHSHSPSPMIFIPSPVR